MSGREIRLIDMLRIDYRAAGEIRWATASDFSEELTSSDGSGSKLAAPSGEWRMCGCRGSLPDHVVVEADPTDRESCGMQWRVCPECQQIRETPHLAVTDAATRGQRTTVQPGTADLRIVLACARRLGHDYRGGRPRHTADPALKAGEAGNRGWRMCACNQSIPGHSEQDDPAGAPSCGMQYRVCGSCGYIDERHITDCGDVAADIEDQPGGYLRPDVPAGLALPTRHNTADKQARDVREKPW
ncbi:hypothetical protein K1T35_47960 (plasmid) [Pseudonocardia sp. DSM 110487]|uniref:hypothetical protein n=1 Tax=Pseudonocardia sp. DSM 110487 TaxID=2865833 RepID=UPI001C6A27B1|nr:hypothetical protein [Pseudonocardia sp. DSM 110487]QYN41087.1 hypothetical protein K1T35_47960 [Pseudonocardia sp. DSM 110487]